MKELFPWLRKIEVYSGIEYAKIKIKSAINLTKTKIMGFALYILGENMDKITKIKNFKIQTTAPQITQLSDFKDHNIVLYFYPKDATPGCTLEGHDFKKHYDEFKKLNTIILGV
ncbi:MAG: redoxin domain-containing protein, partial [Gammaproteobacteria bacterium]